MSIEETLRIALDAHEGQLDLDGNPVIFHILAVGYAGENELEQKAGFLHDVVEDSPLTLTDLKKLGVEPEVVEAVDLLTNREDGSYEDYVRRIVRSGNEIAIHVKLHDLRHNQKRAEITLGKIDPSRKENKARYDLISGIVRRHDWAERYISSALASA